MRFVLRLLSMFALAVAVIMAVVDATRSIAAGAWKPTPLGQSWQSTSPDTYALVQDAVERTVPMLWEPVVVSILALPGWLIFALLAFLFYAIGHRRQRRSGFPSAAR
ncbi:hypothetical protein [Chelativorans salis]|uniref:Uncharacterized protein n=1 Tax=Chelativorans salis TaxID=2978478 RepID=A0ABT2LNN1_9HYPH|nr:hypothetical protein [Chelativorans sp. EGI FJ00035]MCT7376170.1 hypothetical protein [Chelativorans sp. EGI FJ00035]